jgi:cyclopropane fatty-acyl-phospholipid synthase-like methyltransferase
VRTLTHEQARAFYDRLGAGQDSQAFYEDHATTRLVEHLELASARSVFEFGCGTGRFAASLLARHLPADASYLGVDVSSTMVALAKKRTEKHAERAEIRQTDGSPRLDVDSGNVDRVVSTYVLDLLSDEDIGSFIDEAHRALAPRGLLGLVSLTGGDTRGSRMVMAGWRMVHRLSPKLVGGCRPITLQAFIDEARWQTRYADRVAPFGLPSEILVAEKLA